MSAGAVRRAEIDGLALGALQGSEGKGQVVAVSNIAVDGKWPAILKTYKSSVDFNPEVLEEIIAFPDQLPAGDREWLMSTTAWPWAVALEKGAPKGFLMRAVPSSYELKFMAIARGSKPWLSTVDFLLNSDNYISNIGISISDRKRLSFLSALAETISRLHRLGVVIGDLAPDNLLFNSISYSNCFLINCDAISLHGKSALAQVDTPDWETPPNEVKGTEATDSYKFGLLAIRLFAKDQSTHDAGAISSVSPELARLAILSQDRDPRTRPGPAAWIAAIDASGGTTSRAAFPSPVLQAAGGGVSGNSPPPASGDRQADRPGQSPDRFLVAQMPTRVPLSAEISLLARISAAPAVDQATRSAWLSRLKVGPKGARVTVVVQAPHELAPLSPLQQVISVPASGDSPPVRFAFRSRGLGPMRVVISAWAGGTFLAELGLEVSVDEAGPYADGPARLAPVHTVQADPGEVTLQVRSDGQRYLFQLLSSSYLFEPVLAEALTAQPSQAVERTVATLRAMATGTGGYAGGNARTWMEQAGVGLWNDMVPELIREQFWLLRDNIKAFSIAAADDVIPWELLYPLARNHDDGFLVEQFPVMRRVYGQQRFRDFSIVGTRYVMPAGSPRNAESEVAAIRRILGEPNASTAAIERLDTLLRRIESGQCGLLHFTCHNTFTADANGSAIPMEGGPFVPLLLNKAITRQSLAGRHPLVFINACRSASTVPEYTRMMGWAQGFMAAGAGAFAGTLWAVRTESAASFAETFYAELTAGRTLGEACRQARTECGRDHDDPTWLAYSVYGDPAAMATTTSRE